MRKVFKSTLAIAASMAAVAAGVATTPSLSSAWGDNGGGRRGYTIDQINHGVLGNKIVFNSITDSVIGSEKNFVGAREKTGVNAGAANVWNGNDITVKDGQEYLIRLYVHNNNPNGTKAVSRNTRVAFNLPTTSAKQVQVNGFIFSDNASPTEYWDYVNFNSDQAFHLEYVYGSALLENNGIGANGGIKLGDEIVTKAASEHGVQIGYDKLDGNVPGCFTYASYVTIRVKAVFDTSYTITQKVRLQGDNTWHTSVNAKVGDKVELQTAYVNTDSSEQRNVTIKSILPKNLRYVPDTTKLFNSNHPNGMNILTNSVTDYGINIGHYMPKANAYVRFTAEVVDNSLQCGSNTLVDWTQGSVGKKTIQDYATVVVNKACTPTPQPKEYKVRVNYVYEDTGKQAADPYVGRYLAGDSFTVKSPIISGYTASTESISATVTDRDLEYTVKYSQVKPEEPDPDPVPDPEPIPTPEPEEPDMPTPITPEPEQPKVDLPNTGPGAVTGSVIALGSIATSAGYYVASRRALRK